MTLLEAASEILTQAGDPLHYQELTKRLLASGLWQTEGKTPEATLRAAIGQDIKKKGESTQFRQLGKGIFGLREWGAAPSGKEPDTRGEAKEKPVQENSSKDSQSSHLSFNDATEAVLDKFGNKQPMHYRDITEKALSLNLLKTTGKTPAATVYAQIVQEIQRRRRRGEQPRFVQHGKGFIGLTKWMATGLAFEIGQHNQQVQKKLLVQIRKMIPTAFEELIGELLVRLGFENVEVTRRSGDGGIDVRGTLVIGDVIQTRMAVQVKRWKDNIQAPTVQQVRGSLGTHEQGLIITTSDFSQGARQEAERANTTPVGLMNGQQLVRLLVENDIGIVRKSYDLIEIEQG